MDEPLTSMNSPSFFRKAYHNLRNPLVVLKGYAALMLDGCGGDLTADQSEWVTDMKKNADHLLALINGLAELSFIEAGIREGKRGILDPAAAARGCVESFSGLAEQRGLKVTLSLPDRPVMIRADEKLITRAFSALIENALLYARTEAIITLREEKGHICFTVQDDGPGIADHAGALQGFFTGGEDREQKGTGLSLLMTQKIAACHGGSLSLQSSPGGTLCTLLLKSEREEEGSI